MNDTLFYPQLNLLAWWWALLFTTKLIFFEVRNDRIHTFNCNRISFFRILFFRILPSHPHFTLSSAFYPHILILPLICILPSYPYFNLSSAFYPLICILPSYSSVRPHSRFTLTRKWMTYVLPVHSILHQQTKHTLRRNNHSSHIVLWLNMIPYMP